MWYVQERWFAGQDPYERADKAEDDMWYVLQENDELKAKIEVQN